ncbi:hypothetical protein ABZX51_003520 [Aspergillus tubingensis]
MKSNPMTKNSMFTGSHAESPICFYFFEAGYQNRDGSTAAYRAILAQLLHYFRDDMDVQYLFSFCMTTSDHGQMKASGEELTDLILLIAENLPRLMFVIDGVDECKDKAKLVLFIQRLSQTKSARIVAFSRPNVQELSARTRDAMRIAVRGKNDTDIALYLSNKLWELAEDGLFPDNFSYESRIRELTQRADGMFLWARLLIAYLSSPALLREDREAIIAEENLLEGLENIYERIFEMICRSGAPERRLAGHIFTWLLHTKRKLTVAELHEAYVSSRQISGTAHKDRFKEFENMVIITCGGLIETEYATIRAQTPQHRYLRFIHTSVRDYLQSCVSEQIHDHRITNSVLALLQPSAIAHLSISKTLLAYLQKELRNQTLTETLATVVSKEALNTRLPLCSYAAVNWPYHLSKCGVESAQFEACTSLFAAVSQLMKQKFTLMAWIETCYTNKSPPSTNELRRCAAHMTDFFLSNPNSEPILSRLPHDLLEFCRDLDVIEEKWGQTLRERPSCIWEELTAFTPSSFLARTKEVTVHSLDSSSHVNNDKHKEAFSKVSQVTRDGRYVVVLSIWAPTEFMALRSNSEASSSIQQVYRYSQGWAAQWNAYSADTQKLVSTLTVLIDKNEVMLQMLHTLWYSTRSKEWYLQFPISIAPDGRHFSVLRTVYVVGLTAGETTSTAMSLPLQEVPQIFNFWQTPQQELRGDNPPWWSVDIGARSTDQDSCNVYFYWIFFDFHAQYICFIDQPLGEQNNIAVFAMTQETHALGLSLALVAHTSKRLVAPKRATQRLFDNEREVRQFMVVFHPSLPLLGLAVSRAICLWSFSTGPNKLIEVARIRGAIENLSFSSCGQRIVATCAGSSDIIDIPRQFLGHQLDSNMCQQPIVSPQGSSKPTDSSAASPHPNHALEATYANLLATDPASAAVFATPSLYTAPDGTPIVSQIRNKGTSIVASHLAQGAGYDNASSQSFPITMLPRMPGIEELRPEMIRPRTVVDPHRLVLNSVKRSWVSLSRSAREEYPMLVEFDQRMFQHADNSRRVESERGSHIIE